MSHSLCNFEIALNVKHYFERNKQTVSSMIPSLASVVDLTTSTHEHRDKFQVRYDRQKRSRFSG